MIGIARARRTGTPIDFHKRPRGRYHSILHRHDGVLIQLEGGSYNRVGGVARVPHDIAHLLVEDAFGLHSGLWGTLAGGGLVQNATFAGGRKPPHAERRAWEITKRAGETLRQAEVVVRAVADVALEDRAGDLRWLRARVGDRWWTAAITVEALTHVCRDLRDAATRWDALAVGESLRLTWPRS